MAHRIEPFRDYSEHEVINLFALDVSTLVQLNADGTDGVSTTLADMKNLSGGQWDAGVVVEVNAGTLPTDVPGNWVSDASADMRAYLGHSHTNAHIGWNAMPENSLLVKPSISNSAIGITLRQTVAYDENGENLLRYPVKKDELQAVGPGETVPVLTRGLVILNKEAFVINADINAPILGDSLEINEQIAELGGQADGAVEADAGKLKPIQAGGVETRKVGTVLAVDSTLGKYLCKLSF